MKGEGRLVVTEPMVTSHDAELHDVAVVVEVVEPLYAGLGRQPGDGVYVAHAPDANGAGAHGAAADEGLVGLGVVKLAHHWPHNGQWRVDGLDIGRATLVGGDGVGVVAA